MIGYGSVAGISSPVMTGHDYVAQWVALFPLAETPP